MRRGIQGVVQSIATLAILVWCHVGPVVRGATTVGSGWSDIKGSNTVRRVSNVGAARVADDGIQYPQVLPPSRDMGRTTGMGSKLPTPMPHHSPNDTSLSQSSSALSASKRLHHSDEHPNGDETAPFDAGFFPEWVTVDTPRCQRGTGSLGATWGWRRRRTRGYRYSAPSRAALSYRGGGDNPRVDFKSPSKKTNRNMDDPPLASKDGSTVVNDSSIQRENLNSYTHKSPDLTLGTTTSSVVNRKKRRRLAILITDLCTRSGGDGKPLSVESIELRRLIAERRDEYLQPIRTSDDAATPSHPKHLLHFLAPKIPAIRHSPDVGHRIRSARSDMDSGVAACVIGTLGYVSARYQRSAMRHGGGERCDSRDMVHDRRFEQLIECLLCGVDVRKRRKEWARMQHGSDSVGTSAVVDTADIESVVDEAEFVEGLSIRDSCRAAWGIAVLRVHDVATKLGGALVADLLMALLLRIRELLLARLNKMRHSDFLDELGASRGVRSDVVSSIDERLLDYSDELAEDAATALWTMAAVRACTGLQCHPLVDVCCLILCTDPWDVRRQAQEIEAVVHSTTAMVGSNDIVERLALSETEDPFVPDKVNVEPSTNATTVDAAQVDSDESASERKKIVLEWLSPTELVDAVWSFVVAIQGSENQAKLAEIDSTFQEIAFDRILTWLNDASPEIPLSEHDMDGATYKEDEELTDDGDSEANSLTSDMSQYPSSSIVTLNREAANMHDQSEASHGLISPVDVDLVELIDASALIALESEYDVEPCIGQSSVGMLEHEADVGALCAIAWAVTEVHDSLRGSITTSIVKTFANRSPKTLAKLSGGEIANLAWAIAKNTDTRIGADNTYAARSMALLVNEITPHRLDLLATFHPAELSRLLWSVASFHDGQAGQSPAAGVAILSAAALTTAAANMHMFCTEDMARLAWAFLALSDADSRFEVKDNQQALFNVLSSVEADLIRWEIGQTVPREENKDVRPRQATVATEFSRFFRRALVHVPFLDSRIDVLNDESSEADASMSTEKRRRPPLKDLPVDILTISKIACSYSRLELENGVRVSDTFTRIAVRLMVSHNSRLIRDCPIQDLARLCEAAARTESPGQREVVSLFARRFLQYVNGPGRGEVISLGARDSIRLMWSLGELGVKFASEDGDASSAHRRLRLATKLPLLTPSADTLERVSIQELLQLLRSLTTLRVMSVGKTLTLMSLSALEKRLVQLDDESQLCEAIAATELLRSSLESGRIEATASPSLVRSEDMVKSDSPDLQGAESDDNEQILAVCNRIHSSTLVKAVSTLSELQSRNLRSVVLAVLSQPNPNRTVIDAFHGEVSSRLSVIGQTNTSERRRNVTATLDALQRILAGMNESENPAAATWLSRMKSLFGFSTEETGSRGAINSQLQNAMESIWNTVSTAPIASPPTSMEPSVEATELNDLIELGVCRRLIDQYRRDSDLLEGSDTPEATVEDAYNIPHRFLP